MWEVALEGPVLALRQGRRCCRDVRVWVRASDPRCGALSAVPALCRRTRVSLTLQAQALDEKVRRITQDTNGKIAQLECVRQPGWREPAGTPCDARVRTWALRRNGCRQWLCALYLSRPLRRAEYQRNKDVVISMLLQVSLNIENPFEK